MLAFSNAPKTAALPGGVADALPGGVADSRPSELTRSLNAVDQINSKKKRSRRLQAGSDWPLTVTALTVTAGADLLAPAPRGGEGLQTTVYSTVLITGRVPP